jgi:hypothetical protein
MAAVELRVMRAIRGESEEAYNKDDDDELADTQAHILESFFNLKKKLVSLYTECTRALIFEMVLLQGVGGSRRSMQNDCVVSVSSFSEGEEEDTCLKTIYAE